jgi:hypothetical protein
MQFYALEGVTAEVKPYELENATVVTFTKDNESRVSDKLQNVMWGKLTTADALKKAGKKITLTASKVVKGEDYVVRVSYPEVGGLGVEGWTTKTAVAHATSTATSDLYEALGKALQKALEADGVLEATHSASGIVISNTFNPKMYKRGVRPAVMADFRISTNIVDDEGVDLDWGVQVEAKNTSVAITSGYKCADMEYFAMGERGDQYRMMGYPDIIETEYLIDPAKEYDVLVVHYAYKGANEGDYKSEKDLIIAGAKGSLDTLAGKLSKATGAIFTKVSTKEEVITPINLEA